jgi:acyl-CoA synthetase (AMP-forming)/AMP-acid ligase II
MLQNLLSNPNSTARIIIIPTNTKELSSTPPTIISCTQLIQQAHHLVKEWQEQNLLPQQQQQQHQNNTTVTIATMLGDTYDTLLIMTACLLYGFTCVPINPTSHINEINEILSLVHATLFWVPSSSPLLTSKSIYSPLYVKPKSFSLLLPNNTTTSANISTVKRIRIQSHQNNNTSSSANTTSNNTLVDNMTNDNYPWTILFTSGTSSGKRKGVPRSAGATVRGIDMHQPILDLNSHDVFIPFWPLHGISSFFFCFYMLAIGGTIVLFQPEDNSDYLTAEIRIKFIHQLLVTSNNNNNIQPTFLTGPPSFFTSLLSQELPTNNNSTQQQHTNNLRQILVSGAPCNSTMKFALKTLLATSLHNQQQQQPTKIHTAYGSTECGLITLLRDEEWNPQSDTLPSSLISMENATAIGDTIGTEQSTVRVLIRDLDSVLCVNIQSCPMFMCESGYISECKEQLDRETFTVINNERYFVTGDTAMRRKEDSRLVLLGRYDDMIQLPSGFKFYPAEIENLLLKKDHVQDVYVFKTHGNDICCVFVVKQPEQQHSLIIQQFEQQLDEAFPHETNNTTTTTNKTVVNYKRPTIFIGVEKLTELPLTSTSKVKRNALADWYDDMKS